MNGGGKLESLLFILNVLDSKANHSSDCTHIIILLLRERNDIENILNMAI